MIMNKIKAFFVTDRQFYKNVFRLLLPIVAVNAMSLILNFCDIFLLGRLGDISETAISAAKIANQPFFLFSMLMFGAVSGASVLCSQYWGKKDTDTINAVTGVTMTLLFPICIILMIVCFVFAKELMSLISNDETVVEMAAIYLRIILFTFVFNLITSLFGGILRSVEKVKLPLIASFTGIVINIILNAILIYGLFGFPALGIRGSAIGTLIARIIETSIILVYIIFFEKTVKFTIKKMFRIHIVLIKDFLRYSMPVIINEVVWGFGVTVQSSVVGHMTKDQYAAYSISNMIEQITFMAIIGFSTVCCILIGKAIGEGKDREAVAKYSRTFEGLAAVFSIVIGSAAFFSRNAIINIFEINDITKNYASQLFAVVTALTLIKGFNCVGVVGIFRGGGDTKFGMVVDIITMYCVSIPLGFFAMYFLKLEVPFVYLFLMGDEIVKLPIYFWRVKSRKWIRNITRSKEELEYEYNA
ncbi:MAG: MATE family efflux transporter [Oscillospiraceae bacterium]|nr:MATE family efflux transporter [Oscillospiraceae bacterium]